MNIFDHCRFAEDFKKNVRKCKSKEEFAEIVKRDLMYYYWSKCEWEIILTGWPSRHDFTEEKIDVWDQISLNWDRFIDYAWEHRKEI